MASLRKGPIRFIGIEGIELNLFGGVVGLDIRRPALKLPGVGRLGLPLPLRLGEARQLREAAGGPAAARPRPEPGAIQPQTFNISENRPVGDASCRRARRSATLAGIRNQLGHRGMAQLHPIRAM